jgi:hypothetical protein
LMIRAAATKESRDRRLLSQLLALSKVPVR